MQFISVYEMKEAPCSKDLSIQNSKSLYIDEQYFNLSTLLEKLLKAAQELSVDEFITRLMQLCKHYTSWRQEQIKNQAKEFCQVEDFGVMLVNQEMLTSHEEEVGFSTERIKNLRARIVVLWSQSEEALSLPAIDMLQKMSIALAGLNNEYLDSCFCFSSNEERTKFIKKLQVLKGVFDKIFFRMLPILTADRVKHFFPYIKESAIAEDKKEAYDFIVKKYNLMQLVEMIAKKIAEENKVKFTEGFRQKLFQKALAIYNNKNNADIRRTLNNIEKAVTPFNNPEYELKSCMTAFMNELSQFLNFVKAFYKDLGKDSALTKEEIEAFLKGLNTQGSEQEKNRQIEGQWGGIASLLKRMTEEPNIKSIFQCSEEKYLACCKAELEQLASCCEIFAMIPGFSMKAKRETNQGFANFIRWEERDIVSAIVHAKVFTPYYKEENYAQGLKESYVQLVSNLSAFYQLRFGGLLARLRYGLTPEQKALKILIATILQHMTGACNNAQEVELSPVMLHLRVQEAIDEYLKGSMTMSNLIVRFNPTLFAKDLTPIFNSFKKDLVLKDINKFDSEELQKKLQFRITRKVLLELKENGMSKLARREKTEGILARLGHYWNAFLALFANDAHTQQATVSPRA